MHFIYSRMLYSSSVLSPFPKPLKKCSSSLLFTSTRESAGVTSSHRQSDFWSELGEMSRGSTASISSHTSSTRSSTIPRSSILKVSIEFVFILFNWLRRLCSTSGLFSWTSILIQNSQVLWDGSIICVGKLWHVCLRFFYLVHLSSFTLSIPRLDEL